MSSRLAETRCLKLKSFCHTVSGDIKHPEAAAMWAKWANIQKVNEKRFVDFHFKGLLQHSMWLFLGGLEKKEKLKKKSKVLEVPSCCQKLLSWPQFILVADEICIIHTGTEALAIMQPWLKSRWTVAQWADQGVSLFHIINNEKKKKNKITCIRETILTSNLELVIWWFIPETLDCLDRLRNDAVPPSAVNPKSLFKLNSEVSNTNNKVLVSSFLLAIPFNCIEKRLLWSTPSL